MSEEISGAGVSFVPVSDPMRALDLFLWDARSKWQKILGIKGRITVAVYLGTVMKGYQAWVVSDERGVRVSSLPEKLFEKEGVYELAIKRAYRFAGFQPRRGLDKLWLAALESGSELPVKKVKDEEVILSAVRLYSACFDIPEDIILNYNKTEKFDRVGPFTRIV